MITKIGIIGGGKLGTGIFQFLADLPFQVIWVFRSQPKSEKSRELWLKKQNRNLKFGLLSNEKFEEQKNRIQFSTNLSKLADCDLIIETITEDFDAKSQLFRQLDPIVKRGAIFTSNTSSIPIISLVPSDSRRTNFMGLHFFHPVKLKNLVEINRLKENDEIALNQVADFLGKTGKFYKILNEPDHFLCNRLFLPLQGGIYNLHEQKQIQVEWLDSIVKENLFPIGIFEFFDYVGIDVIHASVTNYTMGDPDALFYKPLILGLKKLMDHNWLGVKTGKGFYDYSHLATSSHLPSYLPEVNKEQKMIVKDIISWYLIPVFEAVSNKVLTRQETEHIIKEYAGASKSPFDLAREIGFNS